MGKSKSMNKSNFNPLSTTKSFAHTIGSNIKGVFAGEDDDVDNENDLISNNHHTETRDLINE